MSSHIAQRLIGKNAEIVVTGSLTGADYRDFSDALERVVLEGRRVTVDLRQTLFIDSRALGFLVEARSKMGPEAITLKVAEGSATADSLAQVKFDTLFIIEIE